MMAKWLRLANKLILMGVICVSKSKFSSVVSLSPHKLPRLYYQDTIYLKSPISLTGENAHYVKNVMRLKMGSQIRVFNDISGEYVSVVQQCGRGKKDDVILEPIVQFRPPSNSLYLDKYPIKVFFAPIKKEKVKLIMEKCTELGIESFCPVITQNTQHADGIDSSAMQDSLRHVLIQSVEQCERMSLPTLARSVSLSEMIENLKNTPNTICFVCRERSDPTITPSLIRALHDVTPHDTMGNSIPYINVFVGPEGGFTEQEFQLMQPHVRFVSLGKNVLRAETAIIAATSMITGWYDSQGLQ